MRMEEKSQWHAVNYLTNGLIQNLRN
jgi:hypothetical protein